jgi:predicted cupin superfamily sugar epimerase
VTAASAAEMIATLGLVPHPEGGYYRETFRAPPLPFELPGRGPRAASTAVYFLLADGDFSAFHVVRSDEVWHHYAGTPLDLFTLRETANGFEQRVTRLGSNVLAGDAPQAVVEAGVLQAARPAGAGFSLCGCTVAPGFDFSDFAMPPRAELIARFPGATDLILSLSRS